MFALGKSSGFPVGQGFLGGGRFRGGPLEDHWLTSEAPEREVPLVWEPFVATDVLDESDEREDEELFRDRFLRGANMPRTSS